MLLSSATMSITYRRRATRGARTTASRPRTITGSARTRRAASPATPAPCPVRRVSWCLELDSNMWYQEPSSTRTRGSSPATPPGPVASTAPGWTKIGTSSQCILSIKIELDFILLNSPQHSRVSDGKRVRITITHMRTEQNYDKLYLTWDICDKGFHSYDTYWHGLHTINTPVTSNPTICKHIVPCPVLSGCTILRPGSTLRISTSTQTTLSRNSESQFFAFV